MSYFNTIFYAFIFFISIMMPINIANANDMGNNYKITSKHLIPDQNNPTKYKEIKKWATDEHSEWLQLEKLLQSSPINPNIKSPYNSFNGKDEIFHISKKYSNLITGTDFYITQNNINEVITSPIHSFAITDKTFRGFLETALKNRITSGQKIDENVTINTPGIVVMYNGSSELKNPMWLVSEPTELKSYIKFIQLSQKLLPYYEQIERKSPEYDGQDTFILYLNVPHAPARYVTLTTAGNIRLSKVGVSSNKNYSNNNQVFEKLKTTSQSKINLLGQ